jgi:hypothetical protein
MYVYRHIYIHTYMQKALRNRCKFNKKWIKFVQVYVYIHIYTYTYSYIDMFAHNYRLLKKSGRQC